jgi:hypothetical protein
MTVRRRIGIFRARRIVTSLGLVVALVAAGLAFSSQAQARSVNLWFNHQFGGGGDSFDNYDYLSQSRSAGNVDWPVSLIFINNATVSKAKAPLSGVMPHTGSLKYAWVRGSWDQDRGIKQYEGKCDSTTNYHMRVYAPSNTDRMYNTYRGYFVVATTHMDYREGCAGQWFGESEAAEDFVLNEFIRRGYHYWPDWVWLGNAENDGHFQSNGWASEVSIP